MENTQSSWAGLCPILSFYIEVSEHVISFEFSPQRREFHAIELIRAEPSASRVRAGIVLIQGHRKERALDEGRAFDRLVIQHVLVQRPCEYM